MKLFADSADISEIRELAASGIRAIYGNYPSIETEVLASSIRTPLPVKQAEMAGASATVASGNTQQPCKASATDKGLEAFLADCKKTVQAIP